MGNTILRYAASLCFILILCDVLTAGGIRMAGRQFVRAVQGQDPLGTSSSTYSSNRTSTTRTVSIKLSGPSGLAISIVGGLGLLVLFLGWILTLIKASERIGEEARWFFVSFVFPPAAFAYCLFYLPETRIPLACLCGGTALVLLATAIALITA